MYPGDFQLPSNAHLVRGLPTLRFPVQGCNFGSPKTVGSTSYIGTVGLHKTFSLRKYRLPLEYVDVRVEIVVISLFTDYHEIY